MVGSIYCLFLVVASFQNGVISQQQEESDLALEGTELVFSFLTHRHGDRTPVEEMMSYVPDKELVEEASAPWGYGQLTNVGRQTAYRLGKFIRRRYHSLLSETYNKSEIYIRSTDSTRTKMTVLTAMAAVYPAVGDTWSKDINWVPVPYTTVSSRYDFNLSFLNCPVFITAYNSIMKSDAPQMAAYSGVVESMSEIMNYDITSQPVLMYSINDLYASMLSLGVDVGYKVAELLPEMKAAANEAVDILLGNEDLAAYQAGVLLNEFFKAANQVIAGNDTQRVRIYSAHDFNVYSFSTVTQITPRQGVSLYGSAMSLELRRVVETGEYVVLPVYFKSPSEGEVYVPVKGCGDSVLCNYSTFYDLTSKFLLDEDTWRTKCGYTDDFAIDTSSID